MRRSVSPPPSRLVRAVLGGALVGATLAGCTGGARPGRTSSGPSQPPVSAFRDGACRTVAPAVLRVGRDARRLGTASQLPEDVAGDLTTDQATLSAAQPTVDADARPAFARLVVQLGLVRLRSDTHSFSKDLTPDLVASYDAAVAACTAARPGGTPSAG